MGSTRPRRARCCAGFILANCGREFLGCGTARNRNDGAMIGSLRALVERLLKDPFIVLELP